MGVRPGMSAIAALATMLSASSLYPLFQDRRWVAPALGAVVVVTAGGMAARHPRLPSVCGLVFGPVALLLYVTALYAGSSALLWITPTPDSLGQLVTLLEEGWDTAETYAAPLPVNNGVRLMTVLGVGLVAATVDLLAVRARRAAPAGLPLLAMYSVPAAVRSESVHWATFAAGSAGYLAMLVADSRTRVLGWGRPVFTPRPDQREAATRPTGSAGRRVGAVSIAVAVAVPSLLPGISSAGLFGLGERGTGGSTTITTADPLVDLKRKLTRLGDVEVLRYRTSSPDPDYLRIFALDRFEGNRWTYSPLIAGSAPRIRDRDLPAVPGLTLASAEDDTTEVAVGERVQDLQFLPLPYAPRRVRISGDDWRADRESLMVFSTGGDADGMTYSVTSRRATPTAGQLRGAARDSMPRKYTQVPELPEEFVQLTREVTAKGTTLFDKAVLLQRWFNQEFTYSLDPPPPSRLSDLEVFLRDREGYCEQFAATMALMTRLLGIPSRVAVGYAPGTLQEDGSYLVRQRDAHAWPELYFEGSGWVRFEPTPPGSGAPSSVGVPDYTRQTSRETEPSAAETSASAAPETETETSAEPSATPEPSAAEEQTAVVATDKRFSLPIGWILGALAVLALAAVPRGVREAARRWRWARADDPAAAATAAWAQLRADTLDHGLGWHAAESPRAVLRRLGPSLGAEVAEPLARITLAQELSRYAPPGHPQRTTPETLRADAETVRSALSATSSRPTRWRARLFPASSLDLLRQTTTRLLTPRDPHDRP